MGGLPQGAKLDNQDGGRVTPFQHIAVIVRSSFLELVYCLWIFILCFRGPLALSSGPCLGGKKQPEEGAAACVIWQKKNATKGLYLCLPHLPVQESGQENSDGQLSLSIHLCASQRASCYGYSGGMKKALHACFPDTKHISVENLEKSRTLGHQVMTSSSSSSHLQAAKPL